LAVATLGFSRVGGSLQLFGYVAGTVHVLAMAVWLGGVFLLSRVVLAGPGDDDLVHAVRGFSRMVVPAWGLTLLTGLFQLYRLDRGHLLGTTHGRLMLLKVLVVAVMVFVAIAARQFVLARLSRAEVMTAPTASRLRRAVGVEAIIGVVVLAITAWMVASPPGNLNASTLSVSDYTYQQRFVDPTGKLDLKVYLSPSKVGRNEVLVQLVKPTTGVSQITIRFDPPLTTTASPVILTVPLSVAGVAHLNQDIGIPLSVAGAWTVTVDVVATAGTFRQTAVLNVLADTSAAVNVSVPTVTQPIVTSPPGVGLSTTTTIVGGTTTTAVSG
jgi:copper transport protein